MDIDGDLPDDEETNETHNDDLHGLLEAHKQPETVITVRKVTIIKPTVDSRFKYAEALADTGALNWIASSAMLGLAIWAFTLFAYIRTSSADDLMAGTVPLGWIWLHFTGSTGFTAASYLSFYIIYAIIDFVELIGLFMFQSGGNRHFLVFWAKYFGAWVSTALKILPWVFALINAISLGN